jgi:hypothetical protein
MPNTALIDPLGVFMTRLHEAAGARPIPLVSTAFDVAIDSGLATVTTTRVFRNAEAVPIEAVMTFPMPVHAALFALEARIDGRRLKASAQRRQAARETYEQAIQQGKAAVLHEEVLRGIHTVSVANLRPGGEVEVTTRWTAALAFSGGRGRLRIPLTVGDVYGCSGLNDSDELVADATSGRWASLAVSADGASVAGARLIDRRAQVPLNRPIDIEVPAWSASSLAGRAADGRRIDMTITPNAGGDAAAALAVLVDASGSMSCSFSSGRMAISNHDAAGIVIRALAMDLHEGDWVDLWEFSNSVRQVGALSSFEPGAIDSLLARRSPPGGGTETGRAVQAVAAGSEARDILLITDGKSHALDVQALAGLGRRVSVLLIGEDSLEARVGHLAALTGGELMIASESNLSAIAAAMAAAIRTPYAPAAAIHGDLSALSVRRGGVDIAIRWSDQPAPAKPTAGVAALAAASALPGLSEDRAAALAEAEGLVTHLTSLVLVDEAGSVQERIPMTRKVSLEAPAVAGMMQSRRAMPDGAAAGGAPAARAAAAPLARMRCPPPMGQARLDQRLRALAARIDWNASAGQLAAGDVSGLPVAVRAAIDALAGELRAHAEGLGIDPRLLVIALAAQLLGESNRPAMRVARLLLAPLAADRLAELSRLFALQPAAP